MRRKNPELMKEIRDYAEEFYAVHLRSPSCREIADATTLKHSAVHNYLIAMNENGMIEYDGQRILTPNIRRKLSRTREIGIVGGVSCGLPTESNPVFDEYLTLPDCLAGKGEVYILYAEGDSMIGAGIFSGDMVLVRRVEEAREGDIVVAWIDGEGATLKRLAKLPDGKMSLHPENPNYPEIPAEHAQIQGIAVKVIRSLE